MRWCSRLAHVDQLRDDALLALLAPAIAVLATVEHHAAEADAGRDDPIDARC